MSKDDGDARINIKSYGERCMFNYECETDCCIEFSDIQDSDSDDDDDHDDDERRIRRLRRRILHDHDTISDKICTSQRRCQDDDDDDVGYTIWNFILGILIGMMCITVCIQRICYKKEMKEYEAPSQQNVVQM